MTGLLDYLVADLYRLSTLAAVIVIAALMASVAIFLAPGADPEPPKWVNDGTPRRRP